MGLEVSIYANKKTNTLTMNACSIEKLPMITYFCGNIFSKTIYDVKNENDCAIIDKRLLDTAIASINEELAIQQDYVDKYAIMINACKNEDTRWEFICDKASTEKEITNLITLKDTIQFFNRILNNNETELLAIVSY